MRSVGPGGRSRPELRKDWWIDATVLTHELSLEAGMGKTVGDGGVGPLLVLAHFLHGDDIPSA